MYFSSTGTKSAPLKKSKVTQLRKMNDNRKYMASSYTHATVVVFSQSTLHQLPDCNAQHHLSEQL